MSWSKFSAVVASHVAWVAISSSASTTDCCWLAICSSVCGAGEEATGAGVAGVGEDGAEEATGAEIAGVVNEGAEEAIGAEVAGVGKEEGAEKEGAEEATGAEVAEEATGAEVAEVAGVGEEEGGEEATGAEIAEVAGVGEEGAEEATGAEIAVAGPERRMMSSSGKCRSKPCMRYGLSSSAAMSRLLVRSWL